MVVRSILFVFAIGTMLIFVLLETGHISTSDFTITFVGMDITFIGLTAASIILGSLGALLFKNSVGD